jgi:hypothetical protein
MMASHELTRRHGAKFRHLVAASVIRPGAAGPETAAGRRRRQRSLTDSGCADFIRARPDLTNITDIREMKARIWLSRA